MSRLFKYILWIFMFEGVFFFSVVADNEMTIKYSKKIDLFLENQSSSYSDQYIKDAFSVFKIGDIERVSTLELSSNIVMTLKDRPLLKSWFHQRSSNIHTSNKHYSDAVNQLIAATNSLDFVYANIVVDRQTVLNKLGNLYLLMGDKKNADKAFFEAMKFPYYIFPTNDNEVLRRLEVAYRRAIMGLIMCRAGNAQKLKEIRIIPAANDLRPKLEMAIKRAEGKLNEEE